ncbi:hypothetical protein B0H66DRAFT_569022 [Apodospora peruviana]|uniref:Nephrocystin 3-like N-terminal domain-containing protein n=1 Tax=Apodospora peruviana TaxID=516989 RepID=A0AAE0HTZ8_9PEZI|nr:hypothetical protein B0H66DRAFT_569022 [Apodospora peruviana]
MADPLSLTASIIAVVEVAGRIASICKQFIEGVEDCPKDLRMILIETSSTKAIFDNLAFLHEHDPQSALFLAKLDGANGPVAGCRATITELEKLLPSEYLVESNNGGSKKAMTTRKKVSDALTVLAWPLKQTKAKDLLVRLGQYKTTINTALSVDTWQDVKETKRTVNQVYQTVTETQRQQVCEWLHQTNPSSLHNDACDLYEPGTCDWVLRMPEWKDWIDLQSRCLWIHGIPGCGKTVLAAHLIRTVADLCTADGQSKLSLSHHGRRCAVLYYYCHHSHNSDEMLPFLRWVVGQLIIKAEGKLPVEIYDAYKKAWQPTQAELLAALTAVLEPFDTVFVVIDALDESKPMDKLLDLIHTLATGEDRFAKVQLLATSRDYVGIRGTMSSIGPQRCVHVSMANRHVEEDIKTYVGSRIRSNKRFRSWPPDVRDQVEFELSRGANGMFRWAACQLDILQRLSGKQKVLKALEQLPATLDETYHRIFGLVDREDWPLLRHVLRMIVFHNWLYGQWDSTRLTAALILDSYRPFRKFLRIGGDSAVGADSGDEEDDVDDDHFYSIDSLREICGCLVTFERDDWMEKDIAILAHYTVREFLESDRIFGSPAAYFSLHPDKYSLNHLARVVFRNALSAQIEAGRALCGQEPDNEKLDENPYVLAQLDCETYCAFSASSILYDHEGFICADENLIQLVFSFLDPSSHNFEFRCALMGRLVARRWQMFRDSKHADVQRYWDLVWMDVQRTSGPQRDVQLLVVLSWCRFYDLADKLGKSRKLDPQSLLDVQLSLTVTMFEGFGKESTFHFKGNGDAFLLKLKGLRAFPHMPRLY